VIPLPEQAQAQPEQRWRLQALIPRCADAEYHNNDVNKLIHEICIPQILFTAMVFLAYVPLPAANYLSPETLALLPVPANAAFVGFVFYAAFYLSLSLPLGLLATALLFGMLFGANFVASRWPVEAFWVALAVHVVAWLAQFYGHGVWERRAPALLDNLFQALFVAPFFALLQYLIGLGFLADFHAAIKPEVERRVAAFKANLKK
jgi:2-hydroxy fatty acid dioxygenase